MWHRIVSLIIKELMGVWQDPKTRISLLAPPLIQLLIFTFAATLDVKNVSIGILNQDHGKQGFELVQRFAGSPTFTHLTHLQSVKEIAPFLDKQKGMMVISLDQEFSRKLDAAKPANAVLLFALH